MNGSSHRRTAIALLNRSILLSVFFAVSADLTHASDLAKISGETKRVRRPVSIAKLNDRDVVVANRDSGTLSLVDTVDRSVVSEFNVGGRPTKVLVEGDRCLVTDSKRNRLVAVKLSRDSAKLMWDLPVPPEPVGLTVISTGRLCSVSCLWSRQVTFVDTSKPKPRIVKVVDLPFSPREQLVFDNGNRLLIADAFHEQIAVLRLDDFEIESIRHLPAHNIRGLTLSEDGQRVYIVHELISETTPPISSEIVWGSILSDAARSMDVQAILDPKADLMKGSRFISVGNNTRGAGDPEAVMLQPDGRMIVASGGVSEIAIVEPDGIKVTRIPAGRRPVAMARMAKNRIVIANQLSDTLSVLRFRHRKGPLVSKVTLTAKKSDDNKKTYRYDDENAYEARTRSYQAPASAARTHHLPGHDGLADLVEIHHITLGESPALTPPQRGEAIFFDAKLSRGNWFSCHSCHTDGHTNGALADTLSDGGEGAPKRVLSLRGAGETGPWAWIGDKPKLEDQVHQTLRLTMQGRGLAKQEMSDLVAFIRSLPAPPAYRPASSSAERDLIAEGRAVFGSLDCTSCHSGTTHTSDDSYDVGLMDERGNTDFNPPSLRGVGFRSGWFHDKRANSLAEVITKYQHQLPRELTAPEEISLLRYLESL